jgi:hypothetical protein
MFNSTVDGQNLSTFEASLVNTRNAEVILSDMCGAAEILAPVCRTVNPFDLIDQAGGHRGRSHRACPAARSGRPAAPWTVETWVRTQLDGLDADHRERDE